MPGSPRKRPDMSMPLEIVNGGQTGDARAGWRGSCRSGHPTGGWTPQKPQDRGRNPPRVRRAR